MRFKASLGRGVGAIGIAFLLVAGIGPEVGTLAAGDVYLDTAAMMVYPHDIDEADIGAMCVAVSAAYSAADGGQDMMDAFLRFERRPQAEETIAELIDDGHVSSIVTMTSNTDCPNLNLETSETFHSVQSTVFVHDRRGGARDMFDLLADESLYLDGADFEEWETLEAPDLGDEADLDLRWGLEDGERTSWKSLVLTVRVERLVGQVTLGSTWSSSRELDLDSIMQLGELMVDRLESGLEPDGTPGSTLVRLVDNEDDDQLSIIQMTIDKYIVFNGAITPGSSVTEAALEEAQAVVDERGYDTRFLREYSIDNGEELIGYVLLSFYQYGDEADAEEDLDARLDAVMAANPDSDIEQLDLEWGDDTLALKVTAENKDGGTDTWYQGYLLVGDEMAYVQVISFVGETDVEIFELLMDHQETCMESGTGCDGPVSIAEIFG